MKKFKRKVGDIVKIQIEDEDYCFGHLLEEPLIAFYDLKSDRDPTIEDLVQLPILFKIWVMNHAITSGRWRIIGHHPLNSKLSESVKFFKQDPISKKIYLYENSKEVPSSYGQCEGLERAAVWSPEHVEDRLRDHYLGMTNKWVESLKLNR